MVFKFPYFYREMSHASTCFSTWCISINNNALFFWIIYRCNEKKYITFSNQIRNTIIIFVNHKRFIIVLYITDISKWGQWCQFLVSPWFHKLVSLVLTLIQGLYITNTCKTKERVLSFLDCVYICHFLTPSGV